MAKENCWQIEWRVKNLENGGFQVESNKSGKWRHWLILETKKELQKMASTYPFSYFFMTEKSVNKSGLLYKSGRNKSEDTLYLIVEKKILAVKMKAIAIMFLNIYIVFSNIV